MEKTEETKQHIAEIKDTQVVYEVSYLLLPTLDAQAVVTQVETMKSAIESAGGVFISDEHPILIDLAYPMVKIVQTLRHKCTTGYFGWMKFEMPQGVIEIVKKALDANTTVLRFLIVKTVKENTLLNGKMMFKKEDTTKEEMPEDVIVAETEEMVEPTATPEELDKSIDDLVIA